MSDLMRMTGLYSGMDTEAVIQQLVSAKSKKVTDLKNEQKKLEWKQTAWQDLNSKIYNLYSKTLSNLRLAGSYSKKSTTVSDPTKATVVANGGAIEGEQTLEVKRLAKAKYITGGKITSANGLKLESSDKLSAIDGGLVGTTIKVKTGSGDDAKTTSIDITKQVSKLRLMQITRDFSSALPIRAWKIHLILKWKDIQARAMRLNPSGLTRTAVPRQLTLRMHRSCLTALSLQAHPTLLP